MNNPDNISLTDFLDTQSPLIREEAVWAEGTMPLEIVSYVSGDLPPREYITSVRSLVFRNDEVLVLGNSGGVHITPGGRREAGETLEQTLRREILEEAGWAIGVPSLIGFQHFRHLAPRPENYPYPYPDFLWLLYMAEADERRAECKVEHDYEQIAEFHSLSGIGKLPIDESLKIYLAEAVKIRKNEKGA